MTPARASQGLDDEILDEVAAVLERVAERIRRQAESEADDG